MAKRVKIPGRLESAETGNIVTGADAIMDDEKGKTQVVINSEVDAAIINLAQGKQDNLTFDSAPTEDSPNPVTSAGVYTADKVLSDAIEAILLLIPSAASALNKLVDMQTMNSSIATATASFKGTYNLVSDLHLGVDATHEQIGAALDALSLGADNNDYAFVQVPNSATAPTEISKTERFKFNGTNWLYEYDLNNSGFTSPQWNAINSGVTSLLVSKLSDLPTNAELTTLLAEKQDNLTFDNVPTAGSPNPVKSGGVYARNNEIVALINALDAAKQDVLTFDNTPTSGSSNPVKSGGVYTAISAVQAAIVALDAAKQNVLTFDSTPTLGSPNPVTSSGIKTQLNRIDGNITTLNDLYEALTQSALVIVQPSDTWPVASPATKTIYRVVDRVNTPPQYYSDYMWNGTVMVLMAEYDNAIDDVPIANSNNLVKSGGLYKKLLSSNMNIGFFMYDGKIVEDLSFDFTDFIKIPDYGIKISRTASLAATAHSTPTLYSTIALYDIHGSFIKCEKDFNSQSINRSITITAEEFVSYKNLGAVFFVIQHTASVDSLEFYDLENNPINVDFIHFDENNIQQNLKNLSDIVYTVSMCYGYFTNAGNFINNSNFDYTDFIEIIPSDLTIYHASVLAASLAPIAIFDANGRFISVEKTRDTQTINTTVSITADEFSSYLNRGAKYFIVQHTTGQTKLSFSRNIRTCGLGFLQYRELPNKPTNLIYVSTQGNDSNSGDIESPLATLQKAISISDNIVVLDGEYVIENPSVLNATNRNLNIYSPNSEKVILKFGKSLDVTYNSSTGLYESEDVSFNPSSYMNFVLYNDGVCDEDTLIYEAERHPLQNGRQYRCDSTAYFQVSDASGLANKKFYYDGSKFVIQSSVELTKIWMPPTSYVYYLNSDIRFRNINFYYANICVTKCNLEMTDCAVSFGCGACVGGITYFCSTLKLTRCEVSRKYQSNRPLSDITGDGVCGSYIDVTTVNEKNCVATLIDCWCHDNQDDGFSDHGHGANTVIGGLYEYNRKAGIVPAAGIRSLCIGVTSRRQTWGFASVNSIVELENHISQGIELIDCLAENNNVNYLSSENRCLLICRNCKSINASSYGYSVNGNHVSKIKLIDCVSLNDDVTKHEESSGDIVIQNGTIVI